MTCKATLAAGGTELGDDELKFLKLLMGYRGSAHLRVNTVAGRRALQTARRLAEVGLIDLQPTSDPQTGICTLTAAGHEAGRFASAQLQKAGRACEAGRGSRGT